MQTLGLRYWAVLMCQQQRLEVDNLFPQLSNGGRQRVVLSAEQLDLGLEVSQPLLLSLSALERSDTMSC